MENLRTLAELALTEAKKVGATAAQTRAVVVESLEFNVEAGRLTLLRSMSDRSISLKSMVGTRQSIARSNQFEAVQKLAEQTVEGAKSSPEDAAYAIADKQTAGRFQYGDESPNKDAMLSRTEEFIEQVTERFPKTILEASIIKFQRVHEVLKNTNGVDFETTQGFYDGVAMFTSKAGGKTSSFNYNAFSRANLNEAIMNIAGNEALLRQSGEQLNLSPLPGKFTGDVIVTPHCLDDFLRAMTGYLGTGALLTNQSIYQDKLGQSIATKDFTLKSLPLDKRFASLGFVTGDGFQSENQVIVENGILRNFQLDQYGAKKLGKSRAVSDGNYLVVTPGQTSFADLVRSTKKGLLLCRFSGGTPSKNGDFSGVAKNSYYIENGEIRFPVSEVMIAGNVGKMFHAINGISKDTINFGSAEHPYVRFSDIVVS